MGEQKRYVASTSGQSGAAAAPEPVLANQSELLELEAEVVASAIAPPGAANPELCGPLIEEIAREMQVPLSNILLGAQTLEKLLASVEIKGSSPNFERVFKIFQRACQQQRHLVDTLLELSQTDEERVLATEPIALETWLPKILAAARERARLWQQDIQIIVEPTLPPLATNGTILARVLTELLAEVSCQAPLGGRITASVRETEAAICFDLQSSAAVTADPTALEALQYLQERERPRRDGAGLSLASKLASLLGGTIEPSEEAETIAYCLQLSKPVAP